MIDSDCEGYFQIKDNYYCSKQCRQERIDRITKRKKDQEDFEIAIITLFPLVEFEFEPYNNFIAYLKLPGMKYNGKMRKFLSTDNFVAYFKLPGMEYNGEIRKSLNTIEFSIVAKDLEHFKSIKDQYF